MKTCPTCKRTYTDESLSFCLDDGTPLVEQQNQGYDPQATLFMAEPPNLQTSQMESRTTAGTPQQPSQQPPSPFSQQPTSQPSVSPYAQQSSSQQPTSSPFTPATSQQQSPYQMPPPTWQPPSSTPTQQPRKRSFLPWIIALIGLLVVGGLGIVLVIAIVASLNSTNENNQNNDNKIVNNNKNTNNSNNSNKTNVNNSNTVNTNNSNNDTTVSRPDYLTDTNLAANSEKGTETTVFEPTDKIYYVYKLDGLPRDITFVSQLVVDSAPGYKTGDAVKADTTLKRNYRGTTYFFFTPGTGGWPVGTYHVELLEKKSDGSLEKLDSIDLTVE